MKYTKSVDGVMRVTIRAEARITREEFRTYNRAARALGYKSLSAFLDSYLSAEWKQSLAFKCQDELGTEIDMLWLC